MLLSPPWRAINGVANALRQICVYDGGRARESLYFDYVRGSERCLGVCGRQRQMLLVRAVGRCG